MVMHLRIIIANGKFDVDACGSLALDDYAGTL